MYDVGEEQVTAVTAISIVKYAPRLTELSMQRCSLTDGTIRIIANSLPHLTCIDLKNNRITEVGCESIARLTGLTFLDLCTEGIHTASNEIKNSGLQVLSNGLTRLTYLHLNECKVGEEGLLALLPRNPQLRDVGVESCSASLKVWQCITSLTAIERLAIGTDRISIDNTKLYEEEVMMLGRRLPNLKHLSIAQKLRMASRAYKVTKATIKVLRLLRPTLEVTVS